MTLDVLQENAARAEYLEKLQELSQWEACIAKGVRDADYPPIVELLEWLRENWRDEYLDLMGP